MTKRKILVLMLTAIIICSCVIFTFNACSLRHYTVEEHTERLMKKCKEKFLDKEYFVTIDDEEKKVTDIDAYLVRSFDGTYGLYFIVELLPLGLGYWEGDIIDNKYYLSNFRRNETTPFKESNIEMDNRYFSVSLIHDPDDVYLNTFATMIDGHLTDIVSGRIYDENTIQYVSENEKWTIKKKRSFKGHHWAL